MSWFQETEDGELISSLPEEVREFIFNKLPQKDAVRARLVCYHWELDINNLFNFSVVLSNNSPESLEHLLELRIARLTLQGCQSTQLTLKHPNIIQELIVEKNAISDEELHKLLQLCQKSVKKLWISPNSTYFTSEPIYEFQNLRKFTVKMKLQQPKYLVTKSSFRRIVISKMARLSSLQLDISFSNDSTYTNDYETNRLIVPSIVELINKNPKGLQELGVNLGSLHSWGLIPNQVVEDMTAVTVTNLKQIALDINSLPMRSSWLNLIVNQRKLEKLCISIGPLSVGALRSLVLSISDTLTDIQIDDVDVNGKEEPLDMSLFQNCPNLRSLVLTKTTGLDNGSRNVHPDLINLSDLPPTLTLMKLKGIQIRSRDLLDFFDSKAALNMEAVALLDCGRYLDLGINANVLEKMFLFQDQSLKTPEVYFQTLNVGNKDEFQSVLAKYVPLERNWNTLIKIRVVWNLGNLRLSQLSSRKENRGLYDPIRFNCFAFQYKGSK